MKTKLNWIESDNMRTKKIYKIVNLKASTQTMKNNPEANVRESWSTQAAVLLHFLVKRRTVLSDVLLDLKDFIVQVILKGFAVLWILFLFLELLVGFGAGAASCPLALLFRLVPLLLLVTVHLSWHPWWQLHPWWNGVKTCQPERKRKQSIRENGMTAAITQTYNTVSCRNFHVHTLQHKCLRVMSVIVIPRSSLLQINY